MASHQYSPTRAPSLFLLAGVVAGFCLARETEAHVWLTLGMALLLCLICIKAASTYRFIWLVCFFAAAMLAAWSYASWRLPSPPDPTGIPLPIREASLHFKVTSVMQARTPYGTASGLGRIIEASKTSGLAAGDRIYFRLKLPQDDSYNLLRGSEIEALGLIETIDPEPEENSFDAYLTETGIFHRFARVSSFEQVHAPGHFEHFCQQMNQRFESYLRLGSPESGDLDRIYIAMLLGQKAELTPEQSERFRASGTMHFFAISGLHIGVIATVLAQFLLLLRVPRKVSPFVGLPLLYLYVEITGASPSAVRAFLMALFFWLGFALCRQRSPLAALAASAVFVLIIAPQQLWSLGFQLSYTVVLSILLFGLPLYQQASERLAPFSHLPPADWTMGHRIYAGSLDALLLVFSVSISAWLASAPLSAAFFGYFSPAAIVLNVLLVNLVAVAIVTGVISLALGTVGLPFFAGFINHAAWLTIEVMDRLVSVGTQIPFSVLATTGFNQGLAYTTLVLYFAVLLRMQQKDARLSQSPLVFAIPPAIILAGLVSGMILA